MAVPRSLVDANKAFTLAAGVFFVDGTAFLLTVAQRIKFVMAEHLPVRTVLSLSKHMKQVLDVYGRAGFRVRTILMDGEFEKLKPLMPSVECNTTAAKEHLSEIVSCASCAAMTYQMNIQPCDFWMEAIVDHLEAHRFLL